MADIKWIKITTDIFDDEKIKIIDTLPARDEILVIWFKLLSLAGKVNQNGLLFMNSRIAYTPEMLAAIFNREISIIKLSLKTFQSFGMITVEDNEVIAIANWEKHQNIDGMDKIREQNKIRQQKYREKQLQLTDSNVTDNVTVTLSNAIDKDKDKDKDKEEDKVSPKTKRFAPPTLEQVKEYCLERNNKVDSEKFIDFYESKGWMVGKNKMKSWKASVRTWEKDNKNVQLIKKDKFNNYEQREGIDYEALANNAMRERVNNG